jgi:hypothetical protein
MEVGGDAKVLEVERSSLRYVPQTRVRYVERGGRMEAVSETVLVPVFETRRERVALKDCKVFEMARGGKLEAVEPKTAARLLSKPTVVLVGESAEVEAPHLALIASGTLYLLLPRLGPPPGVPKMPRDPEK